MWELDHKEGWVPRNSCFWTVVLEKTLESPLDFEENKPVILKEINPEYSSEGLMPKLQYFGHLMWRVDSWKRPWCWKILRAREGGHRGWDGWMQSSTQWIWVWANSGRWWRTRKPGMPQFMGSQRVGHDEQLNHSNRSTLDLKPILQEYDSRYENLYRN